MIQVKKWSDIKSFTNSRSLSIQFVEFDDFYHLIAIDGAFCLEYKLDKNPTDNTDLLDFETNYKSIGNKCPTSPVKILSQPAQIPFAAKTIIVNGVTKNLFKRATGVSFELTAGVNTLTWTQSDFPWIKFEGIEVINGEVGDTCDFIVLDTATGTYSGHANYPLNQFAFGFNVAPVYHKYESKYDSDMYQNLQIKFIYTSKSDKTIYFNFDINQVV